MGKSLHDFRVAISEILHNNILRSLRNQLGDLLTKRKRVIILIDNLDKAWDRRDDLEHLSDFLFGLLSVIFLRSDIFERVIKDAREPDKIPCDKLLWNDPVVLMRIVNKRLAVNREGLDAALLWGEVFCPTVKNKPSKQEVHS